MERKRRHNVAAFIAVFLLLGVLLSPVSVVAQTNSLPAPDFTNGQATTSASSATLTADTPDREIGTIKNILTGIDSLAGSITGWWQHSRAH